MITKILFLIIIIKKRTIIYINIIDFNEKDDLIIFTINNGNNFIYASLSSLINKKYNIGKDTNFIYEFNYSQK